MLCLCDSRKFDESVSDYKPMGLKSGVKTYNEMVFLFSDLVGLYSGSAYIRQLKTSIESKFKHFLDDF